MTSTTYHYIVTPMSYDIDLIDPLTEKVLVVEQKHTIAGGTYQLGGTTNLSFNITWNYAPHLRKALGENGVRTIYGMTGEESIPILEAGIAKLGDDINNDYWESTEGNTKTALRSLLELAQLGLTGIWDGD